MYLQWTKLISTVQDAKDITLDLPPSLPLFLLSSTNERGHAKYPFHGRRFVGSRYAPLDRARRRERTVSGGQRGIPKGRCCGYQLGVPAHRTPHSGGQEIRFPRRTHMGQSPPASRREGDGVEECHFELAFPYGYGSGLFFNRPSVTEWDNISVPEYVISIGQSIPPMVYGVVIG